MLVLSIVWLTNASNAQRIVVYDVVTSDYPEMKAKFWVIDPAGRIVRDITPEDVVVEEFDRVKQDVSVTCPPPAPPQSLSVVILLQRLEEKEILVAKLALNAWIREIAADSIEFALISYSNATLVHDFTTSRDSIRTAINAVPAGGWSTGGLTDALTSSPNGAFQVLKRARWKRVILHLCCSGDAERHPWELLAEAEELEIMMFSSSFIMSAGNVLHDLCARSGGFVVERLQANYGEVLTALRHAGAAAQASPCELRWRATDCKSYKGLRVSIPRLGVANEIEFETPREVYTRLEYLPSAAVRFGETIPGTRTRRSVTITARRGAVHVQSISPDNPAVRIVDYGGVSPPFTVYENQRRTLTLEFSPADSCYTLSRIEVDADVCLGNVLHADGGWLSKPRPERVVRVIRPNGGERFGAGSEQLLTWDPLSAEERVRLEYSIDVGFTWMLIADSVTGTSYRWDIPNTPSETCLFRVQPLRWRLGEMVLISDGTFRMGDMTGVGTIDEVPVRQVTITQPFLMSHTEVTHGDFNTVLGYGLASVPDPDLPVGHALWYDAVAYCNARSKLEGLDTCYSGSGRATDCDFLANGYRLPTEAEWEYSCRAGSEADFSTGNLTHNSCAELDSALDAVGWYCANTDSMMKVALKASNAFGLFDMHGNVHEWCWDSLVGDYYSWGPSADPRGGIYYAGGRATRGGRFSWTAYSCRSAARSDSVPEQNRLGFRVVRNF